MKKTILLLIVAFTFLLSSCLCEHNWLPATCSMPTLCEKCGLTSGSPVSANHKWSKANCITQAVCEICNSKGEYGEHVWISASYERAKYCSICKTDEGLPLLDSSDIRYILAACAYKDIYNIVDLPSTLKIERVRYSYSTDAIPYITVVLDCSAENPLGGHTLVRCYSYNVTDSQETAISVLPFGEYHTYSWPYDEKIIYCRIEDTFETPEDTTFLKWDELIPDLVIQKYNQSSFE